MKAIGLVAPVSRPGAMSCAVRAAAFLHAAGVRVYAEEKAIPQLPDCRPIHDEVRLDAVVTLGGDGTLLRGAQLAVRCNALLLGINLGQMGFLAEIEPDMLEDALQALLDGDYAIESRPVLQVQVDGANLGLAMNDAVLTRGGYARLITVRAMVDGEEAACYRADGLIVATPTGSTGYSLSAGGPIVSPRVDCMVITPVCAHSLQHRPAVVDGGAHIELQLMADDEMTAALQVDGQNRALLHSGQTVGVSKSDLTVRLVRLDSERFFHLVRQKLAEWSS